MSEYTVPAIIRFMQYPWKNCLDVGSGPQSVLGHDRKVYTLDFLPGVDFVGDFLQTEFSEPFGAIWCSHVLEHQPNPGLFLQRIRRYVVPDGVVAITVPPWRDKLVGGHLHLWNEGHLLYNMILAGFDCSQARVGVYGYSISVIVRRKDIDFSALPTLKMDKGDIEILAPFFPFPATQGCNGKVGDINW